MSSATGTCPICELGWDACPGHWQEAVAQVPEDLSWWDIPPANDDSGWDKKVGW